MHEDNEKDEAIESGIVILSGGRDVSNNLLLTIPTNKVEDITEWEKDKLTSLFLHMADIAKCLKLAKNNPLASFHCLPLAFLADLRQASTVTITLLVESLEAVEHNSRGTISAVYFLSPKKKSKSHTLKKLLGLKPSKKRPRVPLFKIALVKTVQDLHSHIDISQLTFDFCGTLLYNHIAWMHFYNVVIKCIEGCQAMLNKLPSIKDRVDLLQEYDTEGHTSSQLQLLLSELLDKFHIIISESSLPFHLVQSKQTLFLLEHPSSDSHISAVHSDLIEGFRTCLRDLFTKLDGWNTDLEDAWKVTESRLTVLIQLHKHRERAKEIQRKICEHYHPLLREHPIVGKTLSQAELYRAHFTTTLYEPAKELLSQATEILEAVQKLKNGATVSVGSSAQYTTFFSGLDISDINSSLTTSIQPFTQQLQQLQQVYVNIHIFHLLFEKTLIWYKKVLKFIPETLLDKCTVDSDLSTLDLSFYNLSPQGVDSLAYMPTEWLGAVRVFLTRHPPPRQEHIDRLDESIPHLVDKKLSAQARSLALRLRLIQRILSSTRMPLQLVKAVLSWRAELFGSTQTEKSAGGLLSPGPAKPRNRSADGIDSGLGKTPERTPSERSQTLNRLPEKSGKRKSLGSLELDSILRSSTLPMAVPERNVKTFMQKKVPSRSLYRAKSVEFNFNSSSTDGSVFDYDRAVSGIQKEAAGSQFGASKDMIRARAYPRRARRKGQESMLGASPILKIAQDESALSDPSDFLRMGDLDRRLYGVGLQRDYKTDISAEDLFALQGKAGSSLEAEPSSTFFLPQSPSGSETLSYQGKYRKNSRRPNSIALGPVTTDERFIRLTFTPKERQSHPLRTFKFQSLESDKETMVLDQQGDEELNAAEEPAPDPYDSLVERIKEISASGLSNTEKLKRVSKLLSESTSHKNPEVNELGEAVPMLGRHSKSSLDLRTSEFQEEAREIVQHEPPHGFADPPVEKPVDAILRMKRNLARSMEELNMIGSQASTHAATSPSCHRVVGYRTELKIDPIYRFAEDRKDTGAAKKQAESDRGETNRLTGTMLSKTEPSNTTYLMREGQAKSWSDLESVSPVSSTFSTGQETHQSPMTRLKSASDTESKFLDYLLPHEGFSDYALDDDTRSTRISLNHLANRNFLSPSFLRPAASMKDLSSRNMDPYTLRQGPDFNERPDYRALEEMEVMRSMKEDPLSNEFAKYSPERKKQARIFSGDFMEKMKTEPEVDTVDQSDAGSNTAADLSVLAKAKGDNKKKPVPDIHVDYMYFVEHMDSPGEDGQEAQDTYTYMNDHFSRLVTEAEQEHLSQEEVASSLRKTQRILEEEELKRHHLESDMSQEESSVEGMQHGARSLSHTTSTDNGYGSWASKLVTALSTSSEGQDLDLDFYPDQDKPLAEQSDLY